MAADVVRLIPAAPGETVSAAEYLYDIGELNNPLDLLLFFEKPHRYPELLALWDEEREHQNDVQGELQDERRATL